MKPKWKKLFLWSSLGSFAFGATVALSRKSKRGRAAPLICRSIPPNCQSVLVWTERFKALEGGSEILAHDKYLFQSTSFKVWSVLNLETKKPAGNRGGAAIFHVTHTRFLDSGNASKHSDNEIMVDRFYGTVDVVDAMGRSCGTNSIARGGLLQIRKCNVGGASNGVESGEVHCSSGRILNYRFEYAPH